MRKVLALLGLVGLCLAGLPTDATRAAARRTGIQTIYLVHTSHWDYGFTDPPQNLPALIRAHVNDAVAKCQADPRARYTIEHTWALEDFIAAASPAEVDALMALVRAGRIAVGSGYSGPHSALMSPEELNRWIYRNKKLRDQYQIPSRAAHLNDNPGYTWGLADALAGSGTDRLVCGIATYFGGPFPLPLNETIFRWQGPGGGRVLTWVSRDGYFEGAEHWQIDANTARFFFGGEHPEWATMTNLQIMEQGINERIAQFDAAGYPYDAVLALEAFDKMNYDPSGQLQADIDAWNATHTSPKIKIATADEFFNHMEATYGLDAFPVRSGNWTFRWDEVKIAGQTSQARFRETRDTLPAAEVLGSVASRFGEPYPAATLDAALRDMMRYDDHGAGAGGTLPLQMTFEEMNQTNLYWTQTSLARRDEVRGALSSGAAAVAARIATAPGPAPEIVVFNPLSSARTELASATVNTNGQPFALRDAATNAPVRYQPMPDGSIQFVAASVPPLGYKRFRVLLGTTDTWPAAITTTATTIENAYYKVTVSATTGAITSILDKTAGNRELVNASSEFAFNRTVRANNSQIFFGLTPRTLIHRDPVASASAGPVSGTLAVTFGPSVARNASPLARAEVRLYEGLKRIDIVNTLDKSKLQYEVTLDENQETFFTPFPFNLPAASVAPRVDANPSAFLRPPTETYLASATEVATNNIHFPSRGITLRDPGTNYEIQVVSPEVFEYYTGTTLGAAFAPTEATLLALCMSKKDRTETDDPGFPELSFIIEPLEDDPSRNHDIFTSRFSVTTGAPRADSASGAWGASVCAPMPTVVVPGGQQGPFASPALSFFSVGAPNVEVLTVKRPDFGDPADVIVRVRERDGLATATSLVSVFPVLSASECTLLEQATAPLSTSPVPIALGPFQTKTLRLRLGSLGANDRDTPGAYVPASGVWFLRNANAPGAADAQFGYGPGGQGWTPLAGDWDGDGDSTPGLYDPATGTFFLKNANAAGPADAVFGYGPGGQGWQPLVGDWDGNGTDTVGLYEPASGFFFLKNANAPGLPDAQFGFGPGGQGWRPLAGDWDNDGDTTVGLFAPSSGFFFLRNALAAGPADVVFQFGPAGAGWTPLAGDWNGDGSDTAGLYDAASGTFFLRNANSAGAADAFFPFGPPGLLPLVGNWDGQ